MPLAFYTICSETNDLGKVENCDLLYNWHINSDGMFDSGVGLPIGQKI